jgi:single-strand DNA-binding protein
MAGYNRIVLVGNLTRDPEYKQLTSGQAVCRLGLATNRQFKNRQTGNMVQEVCYIDIDVWGAQAESCRQYLQKGRAVLIEGRLKFDTWEDPQGKKSSKHSVVADRVVFLSSNAPEEDSIGMEESTPARTTQFAAARGMNQTETTYEPQNELEKGLMDQINQIKGRASAPKKTTTSKSTSNTGEIEFSDQPPFEDELPF